MVWNVHRRAPVATSKARMFPGDAPAPSPARPPMISRSLVDDARRGQADRLGRRIAAEVARAGRRGPLAEGRDGDARSRHRARRDTGRTATNSRRSVPLSQKVTPRLGPGPRLRVERPLQRAPVAASRATTRAPGWRVDHAVHDDRVRLQPAFFARVPRPGKCEAAARSCG